MDCHNPYPGDLGHSANGGEIDKQFIIPINTTDDIVKARQHGRALVGRLGFSPTRATLTATVISELARNILMYAGQGEISFSRYDGGDRLGISITASDDGPGLTHIGQALMAGYSTSGGFGFGLSGVRKIADEFQLDSQDGSGTTINVIFWSR